MIKSSGNRVVANHPLLPQLDDWSTSNLVQRLRLWRDRKTIPSALPWVQASPWALENYLFLALASMPIVYPLSGALGLAVFAWWPMLALFVPLSILGSTGLVVGGKMSHITVDQSGLWLRHRGFRLWPTSRVLRPSRDRFLPAEEIGPIWVIEASPFGSIPSTFSYNSLAIGAGQLTIGRGANNALLIKQNRKGLNGDHWLLEYAHTDSLAAAITLSAAGAQSAATTDQRLQNLFGLESNGANLQKAGNNTMTSHLAVEGADGEQHQVVVQHLTDELGQVQQDPPSLLRGTVDVFVRQAASDGPPLVKVSEPSEPGHPAERLLFHGEFHTNDGRQYAVGVLTFDGVCETADYDHAAMGAWLAASAGVDGHEAAEQLYQFADEESLMGALQFLHSAAGRRTDIRVIADNACREPGSLRRAVVYEMVDSIWMVEHIQATDDGRFLRLRSTGSADLATYLGQVIVPDDSSS